MTSLGASPHEVVSRITQLPRPCLVGLTGSVAVGKTTLANRWAVSLKPAGVAVVSTDGFLFPNAVLERRGQMHKKGFPETYDLAALRDVLSILASGIPVAVPQYSHTTYDVVVTERIVPAADIYIIEGVAAFAHRDLLDLAVYLDADEADVYEWYSARVRNEIYKARSDDRSFYRQFIDMAPDDIELFMLEIWRSVNAINLHTHIEPQRDLADVILRKNAAHEFVS